ncbi:MAG: hypothetical protein ACI81R_003587 [Bradymonadia bacterium]|jgi:hypothetical protein
MSATTENETERMLAGTQQQMRLTKRIELRTEAKVRLPEDRQWLPFGARDVSVGGLFLESQLLLDVGTRCAVELPLPDGSRFRGHAQVVRLDWGEQDAPGMGLSFLETSDLDRLRLRRVLGT